LLDNMPATRKLLASLGDGGFLTHGVVADVMWLASRLASG
jgi:hypothetical protein